MIKALKLRGLYELDQGDLIRNRGSGQVYVVVHIAWPYGLKGVPVVTAVRSMDVTNVDEWLRIVDLPPGADGPTALQRRYDAGKNRDCPYLAHADDCDCNGMGGDR